MCDIPSTLKSSLLFWTLSLIPSNIFGYIALSIVPVLLMVYTVHSNRPSAKLSRLNDAVAMTDDILTRAKAKCMRDHLLLAESETRLLRAKFSASTTYSYLLETQNMSWKIYLQNMIAISRRLAMCEHELRSVRTSLLLLIEAAHQRRLAKDINEGRENEDWPSLSPHSGRVRVRHHSAAPNYEF
ncbi:hypothetical protein DFH08DRAFT_866764 [Mycena albidolilacea]|uniref:Uncharacterized protein n=1 Tax=Mycena albidolilacea TaxID=1033008 RepID=A0AAD7A1U1_9AGAR|nr:hypothetical protein DFH08DRAFT_866764 [Mycena albidolilacea]